MHLDINEKKVKIILQGVMAVLTILVLVLVVIFNREIRKGEMPSFFNSKVKQEQAQARKIEAQKKLLRSLVNPDKTSMSEKEQVEARAELNTLRATEAPPVDAQALESLRALRE